MPETVTFRKDIGVVQVISSGKVTGRDIQATLQAVDAINRRHGIRLVLVDTRGMTETPSTVEMFDALSTMAKHGMSADLRFAVVMDEDIDGIMHFGENVAQNRGVNLQLFDDRDTAMKWLEE